jgi:transglutaminase-like putative cysteine protease
MRAYLGRLLGRFLSGLLRLAGHLGALESPWQRVPMRVPTSAFGPGSRRQFADYFAGESTVRVASIDDIVEWLHGCEYVTDTVLFNEPDLWQHPAAFEQLRRGDCEDFALWAWRKLAEIGVDAEFYVGRVICGDESAIDRQHAWVVYRVNRTDFLFEPAAQSTQRMIRPLAEAQDEYVPHFAVDRRFGTCAFLGCILDSYRDKERRRNPTRAA